MVEGGGEGFPAACRGHAALPAPTLLVGSSCLPQLPAQDRAVLRPSLCSLPGPPAPCKRRQERAGARPLALVTRHSTHAEITALDLEDSGHVQGQRAAPRNCVKWTQTHPEFSGGRVVAVVLGVCRPDRCESRMTVAQTLPGPWEEARGLSLKSLADVFFFFLKICVFILERENGVGEGQGERERADLQQTPR